MGSMKEVVEVLNGLLEEGVLKDYAIGGGMAALAYVEPFLTEDIDVFTTMTVTSGLVDPAAIFRRLRERGFDRMDGDRIIIHGWPVQFLPPLSGLEAEALSSARERIVEGVQTRFFCAEHLMAIAVKTGRGKDMARLEKFIEAGQFDETAFSDILKRHNLTGRWNEMKERFFRHDDR